MTFKPFLLIGILTILLASCNNTKSVLEVTNFRLKSTAPASTFNQLDAQVEDAFTSKQPGFIKRQSGVDENGNYVVLVYWNSQEEAAASMEKFMSDASVADYAAMIEPSTMSMERYNVREGFSATGSEFIEVMSFDTKEGTDMKAFKKTNKEVETGFTAKQTGFMQRLTGRNEEGKQIVAVYWDNKKDSDQALQPFMSNPISKEFMGMMVQSSIGMNRVSTLSSLDNVEKSIKEKAVALLNSFNTGDQEAMSYVNPNKYIQHNLSAKDGMEGFGEIMQNAPPGGFKANVVRAFQDGDYAFTHTEYDFFGPKVGFDIFRFEDGKIVEHWDNLLEVQKPNPSGHTQTDGSTVVTDLDKTDANKDKVKSFIETILLGGEMDKITSFINPKEYVQHNPAVADGLEGFGAAMQYFEENGLVMEYDKLHMVLGQGNFVLTVSEGKFGKGEPTAFYDLFRLEDGLIVEHWDVISPIPPKDKWMNDNGKF